MPPKKKGNKKKHDDDYWETAGESIPNSLENSALPSDEDVPAPAARGKGKKKVGAFSGFAALDVGEDDDDQPESEPEAPKPVQAEDEEEDFGGLMSAIKQSSKKDKKKKGMKETAFEDGAPPGEGSDTEAAAVPPPSRGVAASAEDEWAIDEKPKKAKGKKEKKGGKKKGKAAADEDEDEVDELAEKVEDLKVEKEAKPASPAPKPAKEEAEPGAEDDDGAPRLLSKKEKERVKKEKEKAKKKAQAAAKKAAAGAEASPSEVSEPATPAAEAEPAEAAAEAGEDEEGDEEGGAGGAADKKKKKKKKKAAEPKVEEKPKGKKPNAALAQLRAAMEERKRLEEEARRAEEEEQRRRDEEERAAAEAERKKEEERQRKKEKEKAKREQARKEGRLLTDKQKKEKAAAEARLQALLASGAKVEGLQAGGAAPKRPIYDNKKKKQQPQKKAAEPAPAKPATEKPKPAPAPVEDKKEEEDKEDHWDATTDEEAEEEKPAAKEAPKTGDEELDEWDASSDEEKEQKPAAKANGAAPAPAARNGKAAAADKAKPAPAAAAPARAASAVEEESSSEEESSEEEDSSEEESSSEDESYDDGMTATQRQAAQRKAEAAARRQKRHEEALAARSKDDMRSPICCILGHVDTGKTKLLDKIRQTNVQEGEAGGITQQIGATYFPMEAIKQKVQVCDKDGTQQYKLPGLLVIDTPGHESFTNLRTRGSSLCNIAVLVVDIMHGLEPQTLESLRLLRDKKTPFIVALNKIDRMYGWEATPNGAFQDSLAKQKRAVQREFETRVEKTTLAFAEQGLNAVLYYDNKNFGRNVSLVPTSAVTGEGVPDMLQLLVNLTQERMSERLMYLAELQCTVLEVKVIEGLGTTIDVVLSNGVLREGDRIVVCGLNGPIVTQVRALLTPQPMKEMRIKGAYVHHKEVKASLGIKIVAPDLEKAIAGSRLLVVTEDDDEEELMDEVMSDLQTLLSSIDKSGRGVCVQASTLGSLEALLDFLKASKIPVSGINIGPVHKKDIMRAATMIEKAKELAVILCFDVPVDKEAEKLAEEMGIKLFTADIIYHLFDQFTAYNASILEAKRKDAAPIAVWPVRLKILQAFVRRDPIIVGCDIIEGTLRVGTPICVAKIDPTTGKKEIIPLGKVTSLEINHKSMEVVKKSQTGAGVAVKIENPSYQNPRAFGRHFDEKDELLSHISRQSIDVLKESFRDQVAKEDWLLVKKLKSVLDIP